MSLKEGEKLTLCSNIIHILGAFYMSVFVPYRKFMKTVILQYDLASVYFIYRINREQNVFAIGQ